MRSLRSTKGRNLLWDFLVRLYTQCRGPWTWGGWSGGGAACMGLAQVHFLMFSGCGSFWCGSCLLDNREHHFREVAKLALSALPESKIGEIHSQSVTVGNMALDIHKTPFPSGISQIIWENWYFSVSFVWNSSWACITSSKECIKSYRIL